MRILYVSQYFPPEMGAPAARVGELSRLWAEEGDDVSVLTAFPHHPSGRKLPGDRWRLFRRERAGPVEVLRTYVFAVPNRGLVLRMSSYLSFLLSAVLLGSVRARRPDVVVATSPQLLCGLAGLLLARRFGVPFVFEVRDLWPESIVSVGAMRRNPVVRGLRALAGFLYRSADRVVTVGPGYRREIESRYGAPPGGIEVVPNGVDPEVFRVGPRDNRIRRELGWEGRTVFLYFGTLGMAHGLDLVLDVAERLQAASEARALFALIGDGAERTRLREAAERRGLDNVQVLGPRPREDAPLVYAAADVCLVLLRPDPLFATVLPSKMFEIFAVGRPVLSTVDGDARQVLEEAGAGLFVPPGDVEALAAGVRAFLDGSVSAEEMGRRGRSYVVEHYSRRDQAMRYRQILSALVTRGAPPSGGLARNP